MTNEIAPGVTTTIERAVDAGSCTRRGDYDIFSTPNMVLLLEETAIAAIAPYLREDQACVGSRVDVAHLAATLADQTVRATATVTAVDRRRVSFAVLITDDVEEVGRATHDRFVIDVAPFENKLAEKAESLNSGTLSS